MSYNVTVTIMGESVTNTIDGDTEVQAAFNAGAEVAIAIASSQIKGFDSVFGGVLMILDDATAEIN